MNLSIVFWVLYIVALAFAAWAGSPAPWRAWGGWVLTFALVGILGYKVFGGIAK